MANVKVKLEYARASSSGRRIRWPRNTPSRAVDVSMAKIAAGEAALEAA